MNVAEIKYRKKGLQDEERQQREPEVDSWWKASWLRIKEYVLFMYTL